MKSVSHSSNDGLGNLRLAAPVSHRGGPGDFIDFVLAHVGRSDDGPRGDGVDQDVVGRALERERFGERDHAGLGDVVRREAFVVRPAAAREPVGEVDDPSAAAGAHVRQRRLRTQKGRSEVHVQIGVPVLDGDILECLGPVDRRHVDEDVDAPEGRHRVRDDRPAVLGLAHIGRHGGRATSGRDDVGDGVVGLLLRPAIRQHEVHASAGEHLGHDPADALAAGDDCDLPGQFHVGITQIALDYADDSSADYTNCADFLSGSCRDGYLVAAWCRSRYCRSNS